MTKQRSDRPPVNVMDSEESYKEFYERLGESYPETEVVYSEELGRARREIVYRFLDKFAAMGLSLLDIGCNDGHYSLYYASRGLSVLGIDISPSLVRKAQSKARDRRLRNARFEVADIEKFQNGLFGGVLFSEVLEHLRNPELALRVVADSVEPGGFLLITTPAPAWGSEGIRSILVDRLFPRQLMRERTHKSEETAIHDFLPESFHFRHNEYYAAPLADWVEGFGFRRIRVATFFWPRKLFQALNARPSLQMRLPLGSLIGVNNVQLFRKRDRVAAAT